MRLLARISTASIALISLTAAALAAEAQAVEVEIVQSGIYELERGSAEGPILIKSTTVIPAELGSEFGFEFNVRSIPESRLTVYPVYSLSGRRHALIIFCNV